MTMAVLLVCHQRTIGYRMLTPMPQALSQDILDYESFCSYFGVCNRNIRFASRSDALAASQSSKVAPP